NDVDRGHLASLFTTATTWNEVDESWPAETINRYVPSADSGTMDFFVEEVIPLESLDDLSYDALVTMYAANVSPGRCRAVEREQRFYSDRFVCDDPEKVEALCAS